MIINSLLDTDFYKFTMGQYAFKYYTDTIVKYAFTNRTKTVKLGNIIDIEQLKKEVFHVSTLRFTFDELQYLRGLGIFSEEYLRHLNTIKLPPVFIEEKDGELLIETTGFWQDAIFWETFILSIVNEMYNISNYKNNSFCGSSNLYDKIDKINNNDFKFIEFGTRRRFTHDWQENVISILKEKVPSSKFIGTSNVFFAKKFGLKPIGTFAHELPMIICGINLAMLKFAHRLALSQWYDLYGEKLSIALTDTFGTDFFFKEGLESPEKWKGLRQDSGNPFTFGVNAINYYEKIGVDPKEKLIVFSDGLDIDKIIKLENQFKGKIGLSYGWGTSLTNDCGIAPLSIVMKATKANGHPLVKLSDNLAKAMGDEEEVERYKKVFGYDNDFNELTIY